DGTAHEVINGLMQIPAEKRPKFGIVPLGSGNDFSTNIGMPQDPVEALEHIFTGESYLLDVATVENEHGDKRYWDNTMSIGLGGVVTINSHKVPLLRGFMMYLVAVIQTIIFHYYVLKVKIVTDTETWEDDVVFFGVCNGPREGGGFITSPDAIMDDGLLDYTIVKKVSRLLMLRMIPEFMNGSQGKFKSIYMGRAKKLEVTSKQPMFLHTDGEIFSGFEDNTNQLTIEIFPKSLEVIVPIKS
ncbi:MAG: YegS/Rv2252/BmrU family lipid kinase, partial [Chloroflexota bacterium]